MSEQAKQAVGCLECEAALELPEDRVIGEIIPCPECGCEMEVTSLEPFAMEMAPEIEEDWGE